MSVQPFLNNVIIENQLTSLSKEDEVTIPHIIKYMGSKKPIIDFITSAIENININEQPVYDLFAGSCSVSGGLRMKFDFFSNDVQAYSEVIGKTYFSNLSLYDYHKVICAIEHIANQHVSWFKEHFSELFFNYSEIQGMAEYQRVEKIQRNLMTSENFDVDFHLFSKYYSGTYWSFEQCVWIDAIRKAAEQFKNEELYYSLISCVMYGMSYTSQSTGHFAQYRDGNSTDAVENIIHYRKKNFFEHFQKKLKELFSTLVLSTRKMSTTTMDFEQCLTSVAEDSTVYCDPPYAPVHYSRFYHALETLVKYDYPKIIHKGRYRDDRHQSKFSQKSRALDAFEALFDGIKSKKSQMVLSYSNNGVVCIDTLKELFKSSFDRRFYKVHLEKLEHKHSTMGRFEDADRDVIEYLIIAKKR